MAATIALKEQTKNRMNFETGYLFCHVEMYHYSHQRASSFVLRLFFFVLAFKLFIALPKAER